MVTGQHAVKYADIKLCCISELYVLLSTNVTSINLTNEKIQPLLEAPSNEPIL